MSADKVPTQFAATLLRLAGEHGYDFSTVLEHAGIDFNPLDERAPSYRREITAMQYTNRVILRTAMEDFEKNSEVSWGTRKPDIKAIIAITSATRPIMAVTRENFSILPMTFI